MTEDNKTIHSGDHYAALKQLTKARIALGRAGISLPTSAHLDFQLAHSQARDAVHVPLDFELLARELDAADLSAVQLQTRADNHRQYLQRPDFGRVLAPSSAETLEQIASQNNSPDIALIIADGLSSRAVCSHAMPLLQQLLPGLLDSGYALSPVFLVRHGRVAIGDPVGQLLSAQMSIILLGERPGLSSPDSLGIYFTYNPRTGRTDADRNCISNIHRHGLSYAEAARKLLYLVNEARRLKFSGVKLKDETQSASSLTDPDHPRNFLLE